MGLESKYPRCEKHDKIKFNENKLSRGLPGGPRTIGLETLV
jgi:hypothetical protein